MGPLAALRRPVPSNRVEPSPCPFQAFLGRTLRDMIVPNPLRPMEAIPLCPITGFPLSAAFSPSAAGGLSACGVPLLGLRLNGSLEQSSISGYGCRPVGWLFSSRCSPGTRTFISIYMPLLTPGNMTPFARFMSSNTSPIHWGSGVTWCNARDPADESISPSRSEHSEFRVQRAPSSPELVERDFFAYPGRPSRPDRRGYRACTVLHDSIIYWMGRFAPKLTADRYFRAHWIWYGALAWSWLFGRACNALFRVPASAVPSGLLLVARKPRTPG